MRRAGTVAAARAIAAAVVVGVTAVAVIAAAVIAAAVIAAVITAAVVGVVGATTVGTRIGSAAAMTAHGAVVVAHRLGDIITAEITTTTMIGIMTEIAIITASTSIGGTGIEMIAIAPITTRAITSPRSIAVLVNVFTLTNAATKMA